MKKIAETLLVNAFSNGALLSILLASLLTAILLLAWLLLSNKRLTQVKESMEAELANQVVCLEQLNGEKDWLMKEIHHRVKNNLQVAVSLLNTQSAYLANQEALEAIRNSQHRMFAISLIHQKLYQTGNISSIDMVVYINELCGYLQDHYDPGNRVAFSFDAVPLKLDVALAVPLGLIINEAISNAYKYAFPSSRHAQISLNLASPQPNHYVLSIADNGIGLPVEFEAGTANSLGTTLMVGLSSQLKGRFEMKNQDGVVVTIDFMNTEPIKYQLAI